MVYLGVGNPVNCGCETVELWAWLLNHPAQVQHPDDLTCDLPEVSSPQHLPGHLYTLLDIVCAAR